MAENRNFSISMRKVILAGPYVLIKKVSKIPKFNKSKEKEYLSCPENKSKPPTQKALCQITAQNGPMVRILKSKSKVLVYAGKKKSKKVFA